MKLDFDAMGGSSYGGADIEEAPSERERSRLNVKDWILDPGYMNASPEERPKLADKALVGMDDAFRESYEKGENPTIKANVMRMFDKDGKVTKEPSQMVERREILTDVHAFKPDGTPSAHYREHLNRSRAYLEIASEQENGGLAVDPITGALDTSPYLDQILNPKWMKKESVAPKLFPFKNEFDERIKEDGGEDNLYGYIDFHNSKVGEGAKIDGDNIPMMEKLEAEWLSGESREGSKNEDPLDYSKMFEGGNAVADVDGRLAVDPEKLWAYDDVMKGIKENSRSMSDQRMAEMDYRDRVNEMGYELVKKFSNTEAGLMGITGDYLAEMFGGKGDSLTDLFVEHLQSGKDAYSFLKENKDLMNEKNYGFFSKLSAATRDATLATGTGAVFLAGAAIDLIPGVDGVGQFAGKLAAIHGGFRESEKEGFGRAKIGRLFGRDYYDEQLYDLGGQIISMAATGGSSLFIKGAILKFGTKAAAVKAAGMVGSEVAGQAVAKGAAAKAAAKIAEIRDATKFGRFIGKAVSDPTAYFGGIQAGGMSFGSTYNQVLDQTQDPDKAYREAMFQGVSDAISATIATGIMNRVSPGLERLLGATDDKVSQGLIQSARSMIAGSKGQKAMKAALEEFASPAVSRAVAKGLSRELNHSAREIGLRGFGVATDIVIEGVEEGLDEAISDVIHTMLDDSKGWDEKGWGNISENFLDYVQAGVLGMFGGAVGSSIGSGKSGFQMAFTKDAARKQIIKDTVKEPWSAYKQRIEQFSKITKDVVSDFQTDTGMKSLSVAQVLASNDVSHDEKVRILTDAAKGVRPMEAATKPDVESVSTPDSPPKPSKGTTPEGFNYFEDNQPIDHEDEVARKRWVLNQIATPATGDPSVKAQWKADVPVKIIETKTVGNAKVSVISAGTSTSAGLMIEQGGETKYVGNAEGLAWLKQNAPGETKLIKQFEGEGFNEDATQGNNYADVVSWSEAVKPEKGDGTAQASKEAGATAAAKGATVEPTPVAEGVAPSAQPERSAAITPEAHDLLDEVDKGGVPMSVTIGLGKIAKANGITVTGKTKPMDIVDQLRAKRDVSQAKAAPAPDAGVETFKIEPLVHVVVDEEQHQMTDGSIKTVETEREVQENSRIVNAAGESVWEGPNEEAQSALKNLSSSPAVSDAAPAVDTAEKTPTVKGKVEGAEKLSNPEQKALIEKESKVATNAGIDVVVVDTADEAREALELSGDSVAAHLTDESFEGLGYITKSGRKIIIVNTRQLALGKKALRETIQHEMLHVAEFEFRSTPEGAALFEKASRLVDKDNSSEFDTELNSFMENEYLGYSEIKDKSWRMNEVVRAFLEGKLNGVTSGMESFKAYVKAFIDYVKGRYAQDSDMMRYIAGVEAQYKVFVGETELAPVEEVDDEATILAQLEAAIAAVEAAHATPEPKVIAEPETITEPESTIESSDSGETVSLSYTQEEKAIVAEEEKKLESLPDDTPIETLRETAPVLVDTAMVGALKHNSFEAFSKWLASVSSALSKHAVTIWKSARAIIIAAVGFSIAPSSNVTNRQLASMAEISPNIENVVMVENQQEIPFMEVKGETEDYISYSEPISIKMTSDTTVVTITAKDFPPAAMVDIDYPTPTVEIAETKPSESVSVKDQTERLIADFEKEWGKDAFRYGLVLPSEVSIWYLSQGNNPAVSASAALLGEKESSSKGIKKLLVNMGVNESPSTFPWCTTFVSWGLSQAGTPITTHSARAFLGKGVSVKVPSYGDVVVFWNENPATGGRNGYGGHTGFYIGEAGGRVLVLSGNSDDSVNVAAFSKDRVLGYRHLPSNVVAKTAPMSPVNKSDASLLVMVNALAALGTARKKKGQTKEEIESEIEGRIEAVPGISGEQKEQAKRQTMDKVFPELSVEDESPQKEVLAQKPGSYDAADPTLPSYTVADEVIENATPDPNYESENGHWKKGAAVATSSSQSYTYVAPKGSRMDFPAGTVITTVGKSPRILVMTDSFKGAAGWHYVFELLDPAKMVDGKGNWKALGQSGSKWFASRLDAVANQIVGDLKGILGVDGETMSNAKMRSVVAKVLKQVAPGVNVTSFVESSLANGRHFDTETTEGQRVKNSYIDTKGVRVRNPFQFTRKMDRVRLQDVDSKGELLFETITVEAPVSEATEFETALIPIVKVDYQNLVAHLRKHLGHYSAHGNAQADVFMAGQVARVIAGVVDEELTHVVGLKEFKAEELRQFYDQSQKRQKGQNKEAFDFIKEISDRTLKERYPSYVDANGVFDHARFEKEVNLGKENIASEMLRKLHQMRFSGTTAEQTMYNARLAALAISDDVAKIGKKANNLGGFINTIREMVMRYGEKIRTMIGVRALQKKMTPLQRSMLQRMHSRYVQKGLMGDIEDMSQKFAKEVKETALGYTESERERVGDVAAQNSVGLVQLRMIPALMGMKLEQVLVFDYDKMELSLDEGVREHIAAYHENIDLALIDTALAELNDINSFGSSLGMIVHNKAALDAAIDALEFDPSQLFEWSDIKKGDENPLRVLASIIDSAPKDLTDFALYQHAKNEVEKLAEQVESDNVRRDVEAAAQILNANPHTTVRMMEAARKLGFVEPLPEVREGIESELDAEFEKIQRNRRDQRAVALLAKAREAVRAKKTMTADEKAIILPALSYDPNALLSEENIAKGKYAEPLLFERAIGTISSWLGESRSVFEPTKINTYYKAREVWKNRFGNYVNLLLNSDAIYDVERDADGKPVFKPGESPLQVLVSGTPGLVSGELADRLGVKPSENIDKLLTAQRKQQGLATVHAVKWAETENKMIAHQEMAAILRDVGDIDLAEKYTLEAAMLRKKIGVDQEMIDRRYDQYDAYLKALSIYNKSVSFFAQSAIGEGDLDRRDFAIHWITNAVNKKGNPYVDEAQWMPEGDPTSLSEVLGYNVPDGNGIQNERNDQDTVGKGQPRRRFAKNPDERKAYATLHRRFMNNSYKAGRDSYMRFNLAYRLGLVNVAEYEIYTVTGGFASEMTVNEDTGRIGLKGAKEIFPLFSLTKDFNRFRSLVDNKKFDAENFRNVLDGTTVEKGGETVKVTMSYSEMLDGMKQWLDKVESAINDTDSGRSSVVSKLGGNTTLAGWFSPLLQKRISELREVIDSHENAFVSARRDLDDGSKNIEAVFTEGQGVNQSSFGDLAIGLRLLSNDLSGARHALVEFTDSRFRISVNREMERTSSDLSFKPSWKAMLALREQQIDQKALDNLTWMFQNLNERSRLRMGAVYAQELLGVFAKGDWENEAARMLRNGDIVYRQSEVMEPDMDGRPGNVSTAGSENYLVGDFMGLPLDRSIKKEDLPNQLRRRAITIAAMMVGNLGNGTKAHAGRQFLFDLSDYALGRSSKETIHSLTGRAIIGVFSIGNSDADKQKLAELLKEFYSIHPEWTFDPYAGDVFENDLKHRIDPETFLRTVLEFKVKKEDAFMEKVMIGRRETSTHALASILEAAFAYAKSGETKNPVLAGTALESVEKLRGRIEKDNTSFMESYTEEHGETNPFDDLAHYISATPKDIAGVAELLHKLMMKGGAVPLFDARGLLDAGVGYIGQSEMGIHHIMLQLIPNTVIFAPSELDLRGYNGTTKPLFIAGKNGKPNVIFAPQVQTSSVTERRGNVFSMVLQAANHLARTNPEAAAKLNEFIGGVRSDMNKVRLLSEMAQKYDDNIGTIEGEMDLFEKAFDDKGEFNAQQKKIFRSILHGHLMKAGEMVQVLDNVESSMDRLRNLAKRDDDGRDVKTTMPAFGQGMERESTTGVDQSAVGRIARSTAATSAENALFLAELVTNPSLYKLYADVSIGRSDSLINLGDDYAALQQALVNSVLAMDKPQMGEILPIKEDDISKDFEGDESKPIFQTLEEMGTYLQERGVDISNLTENDRARYSRYNMRGSLLMAMRAMLRDKSFHGDFEQGEFEKLFDKVFQNVSEFEQAEGALYGISNADIGLVNLLAGLVSLTKDERDAVKPFVGPSLVTRNMTLSRNRQMPVLQELGGFRSRGAAYMGGGLNLAMPSLPGNRLAASSFYRESTLAQFRAGLMSMIGETPVAIARLREKYNAMRRTEDDFGISLSGVLGDKPLGIVLDDALYQNVKDRLPGYVEAQEVLVQRAIDELLQRETYLKYLIQSKKDQQTKLIDQLNSFEINDDDREKQGEIIQKLKNQIVDTLAQIVHERAVDMDIRAAYLAKAFSTSANNPIVRGLRDRYRTALIVLDRAQSAPIAEETERLLSGDNDVFSSITSTTELDAIGEVNAVIQSMNETFNSLLKAFANGLYGPKYSERAELIRLKPLQPGQRVNVTRELSKVNGLFSKGPKAEENLFALEQQQHREEITNEFLTALNSLVLNAEEVLGGKKTNKPIRRDKTRGKRDYDGQPIKDYANPIVKDLLDIARKAIAEESPRGDIRGTIENAVQGVFRRVLLEYGQAVDIEVATTFGQLLQSFVIDPADKVRLAKHADAKAIKDLQSDIDLSQEELGKLQGELAWTTKHDSDGVELGSLIDDFKDDSAIVEERERSSLPLALVPDWNETDFDLHDDHYRNFYIRSQALKRAIDSFVRERAWDTYKMLSNDFNYISDFNHQKMITQAMSVMDVQTEVNKARLAQQRSITKGHVISADLQAMIAEDDNLVAMSVRDKRVARLRKPANYEARRAMFGHIADAGDGTKVLFVPIDAKDNLAEYFGGTGSNENVDSALKGIVLNAASSPDHEVEGSYEAYNLGTDPDTIAKPWNPKGRWDDFSLTKALSKEGKAPTLGEVATGFADGFHNQIIKWMNDKMRLDDGRSKGEAVGGGWMMEKVRKQYAHIIRGLVYATDSNSKMLDTTRKEVMQFLMDIDQGTFSKGDAQMQEMNLIRLYAKVFGDIEGQHIMRRLVTGIAGNIGNAEIWMLRHLHHQDARVRRMFGKNKAAWQEAVRILSYLQKGFDGQSGRDGSKTDEIIYKERLEKAAKGLGTNWLNHSRAYVIASLQGITKARGGSTHENLINWISGFQGTYNDLIRYEKAQKSRYNRVSRYFNAKHADVVGERAGVKQMFELLKPTLSEYLNNVPKSNTANVGVAQDAMAMEYIQKTVDALKIGVDDKVLAGIEEYSNELLDIFKEMTDAFEYSKAILSRSAEVSEEESPSKSMVVGMDAQTQFGSIVPLRSHFAANPHVERVKLGEGKYTNDPLEKTSLKESSLLGQGGRRAFNQNKNNVFKIIDLNGLSAPLSMIRDTVDRVNVSANYAILRELIGKEEYTRGLPTVTGAPRLLEGNSIKTESFDHHTWKVTLAALAREIENDVMNDSQMGVHNTKFSKTLEFLGSTFIFRALFSLRQMWNQSAPSMVGLIMKKAFTGQFSELGLMMTNFGEVVSNSLSSALPGDVYDGEGNSKKRSDQIVDFVRLVSPMVHRRGAEGFDRYEGLIRTQVPVGSNKLSQGIGFMSEGIKNLQEKGMDLAIAKVERILSRTIFMTELMIEMKKIIGDRAPKTMDELLRMPKDQIPDLAVQLAQIKVSDHMGQSDQAKKAFLFQSSSQSPTLQHVARTMVRFSNHTATTASNATALIPSLFGQDQGMRREAAENLIGTMVQNIGFQLMKFEVLLPLAGYLVMKAMGDDDDEAARKAQKWSNKIMKEQKDDNFLEKVYKPLIMGPAKELFSTKKDMRASRYSAWATLGSKVSQELAQVIPYAGVLSGYSSFTQLVGKTNRKANEELASAISDLLGERLERGVNERMPERDRIEIGSFNQSAFGDVMDSVAFTAVLHDYANAGILTAKSAMDKDVSWIEPIIYALAEFGVSPRELRTSIQYDLDDKTRDKTRRHGW